MEATLRSENDSIQGAGDRRPAASGTVQFYQIETTGTSAPVAEGYELPGRMDTQLDCRSGSIGYFLSL
jgi:hypothetical protein